MRCLSKQYFKRYTSIIYILGQTTLKRKTKKEEKDPRNELIQNIYLLTNQTKFLT